MKESTKPAFGETYHKPVLVNEVLEYLNPQPGKTYIDATFGGGGHTRAILEAEPKCTVIGIDWDVQALEMNAKQLEQDFPKRFIPLWGNFAQLPLILKRNSDLTNNITTVDGILADFGTSQFQIKHHEGFSFATDAPLDMRMSTAHQHITAADIVNRARPDELEYILKTYGEEWDARKIVQAIATERRKKKITTTKQLVDIIITVKPIDRDKKRGDKKKKRINPATKTFQALRIVVNKELENIEALLKNSINLLNTHGRLVCISFHSLEDRIVKTFLRDHPDEFQTLTKKVVQPTEQEILTNPSARSSRLRAAERL